MCSFAFNGEKNADFNRCFDNYLFCTTYKVLFSRCNIYITGKFITLKSSYAFLSHVPSQLIL